MRVGFYPTISMVFEIEEGTLMQVVAPDFMTFL